MGNCISAQNVSKKENATHPIGNIFKLPSPLPTWPLGIGKGFARGTIDLGGLVVCQVTTLRKIWAAQEGGPDNLGATIFEPSALPDGFSMLCCYCQPNNKSLSGWVLVGKDSTNIPSKGALKQPLDYTLIWSSESLKIKQDNIVYIWLPTPPDGYSAVGYVTTNSPQKPPLDKIHCVHADFTDICENDDWSWGTGKDINSNGINIYSSRPRDRRLGALGVPTGTFIAQINGLTSSVSCLKNIALNSSNYMPNLIQLQALMNEYSPLIYFHPDEDYFPSSTTWFFQNGALLYTKGQESNPVPIDFTGSNLPQGGSNDGLYWLDLPVDNAAKDRVKRGNLPDACAYLHVKPMLGVTFTDVAVWIFYPFNGPAKAKVGFININLGKIGEHVGDWEHVTLRISNFTGELKSVYFSQHSKGIWIDAAEIEYYPNTNRPIVYSSLHGHAAYPKPGVNLQGNGSIGIRNDAAKGKVFWDTGVNYSIISAEYLESVEPPWLNYAREWGPKIRYDIADEMNKATNILPGKLKRDFVKFVNSLPNEVLGEEGPTGPKWKDNWDGDERD
ncbi:hypothetical protein LIER_40745 [Lithospermum erythrorhizon]|uniref:Vacuolar protein sorting-associated protein 62 n=1 Tax=Lithospermum erythrorhizon TaxID=34254 RepID=A0AAV3R0F9_LITER